MTTTILQHQFKAGDRLTVYGRPAVVERTPAWGSATGWIRWTVRLASEPDVPVCTFVEDWRKVA